MAAKDATITLTRARQEVVTVGIKGTTPLIVHQWSQKAKQMMLDKQMGKKVVKVDKDPAADYEACIYRLSDGRHGFPATGLKCATVSGAREFKGAVTMTSLRPLLYVQPDDPSTGLIAIEGAPRPREDMVRVGQGTADIRFRAEYPEWSMTAHIAFLPHMIDAEAVLALVDAGGRVGLGEWRPEKGGIYGTFEVVDVR